MSAQLARLPSSSQLQMWLMYFTPMFWSLLGTSLQIRSPGCAGVLTLYAARRMCTTTFQIIWNRLRCVFTSSTHMLKQLRTCNSSGQMLCIVVFNNVSLSFYLSLEFQDCNHSCMEDQNLDLYVGLHVFVVVSPWGWHLVPKHAWVDICHRRAVR